MKKLILFILLTGLMHSCGTLGSTTYIDPNKSFVLGQANHGGYVARVANAGETSIMILLESNGNITSLGNLEPGKSARYRIKDNNIIRFQNDSNGTAVIKINVIGDTDLGMRYEEN